MQKNVSGSGKATAENSAKVQTQQHTVNKLWVTGHPLL